jgi:branched-chain amino acid transport system permease protein
MATGVLSSRLTPLLVVALFIALAPLAFPSNYYFRIGALLFINTISVTGLVVLMGYAGQISLGHAGFFGIGAYAAAVGPAHLGLSPVVSLIGGVVLAMLVAALIGRPILRLRGHYLAVATLGFGILVYIVATNEAGWTGGPDGMAVETLPVRDLIRLTGWRASTPQAWYIFLGVVLIAVMWLTLNLRDSPSGRALRALHDSPVAASTLGVDVGFLKLQAFVLSAALAGLAGGLFAQFNQFVNPAAASFTHSVELVAMAVLGGSGSIIGALVGAALLTVLPQALTFLQAYESVFLGLIMMLTMIFMGRGLVPTISGMLGRQRA